MLSRAAPIGFFNNRVAPPSHRSVSSTIGWHLLRTGTIADTTPLYSWEAVSGSTQYRLHVEDVGVSEMEPVDAGCADGTGTCEFDHPFAALSAGDHLWYVSALVDGFWGLRSEMSFNVSP